MKKYSNTLNKEVYNENDIILYRPEIRTPGIKFTEVI